MCHTVQRTITDMATHQKAQVLFDLDLAKHHEAPFAVNVYDRNGRVVYHTDCDTRQEADGEADFHVERMH